VGAPPRTYFSQHLLRARNRVAPIPGLVVRSRRSWRRILVGALVVGLAGALAGIWVLREGGSGSKQPALQTVVARRGDIVITASGTGTLQPAEERDLSFRTGATLASLNVKEGDTVRQG
jgi:multidrug efflux pump subunit AcrA (membrane-fusion protein)